MDVEQHDLRRVGRGDALRLAGVAGLAVFAPAGTPRDIVARWNAELQRIFKPSEVAERLKTLGPELWMSTPEVLARFQAAEITKWAKLVKDSGAKAE